MTAITALSDIGAPPNGSVVLRTSCWCCGEVLHKEVPRRNREHRHFTWRCNPCDVAWTGPGTSTG